MGLTVAARRLKRKKTIRQILVSPLWAGLLLLGGPAHSSASAAADAAVLSLELASGQVSLSARDARLQQVVDEVVALTGLRLIQNVELEDDVTLMVDEQPLHEFLSILLDDYSYQLFQAAEDISGAQSFQPVPGTLWIFSAGHSPPPGATAFLEAVLHFGSFTEKKEAIRELRRLGTDAAIETLGLALQDPDKRLRDAALDALSAIGSDGALAAIASTAFGGDLKARSEAINALSSGNAASALRYLELAMADPDPRVRMSVIDACADIPGEYAAMAISRALEDPDQDVREHALDALDEVRASTAFEALLRTRQ